MHEATVLLFGVAPVAPETAERVRESISRLDAGQRCDQLISRRRSSAGSGGAPCRAAGTGGLYQRHSHGQPALGPSPTRPRWPRPAGMLAVRRWLENQGAPDQYRSARDSHPASALAATTARAGVSFPRLAREWPWTPDDITSVPGARDGGAAGVRCIATEVGCPLRGTPIPGGKIGLWLPADAGFRLIL
jgi:hypothetical protein